MAIKFVMSIKKGDHRVLVHQPGLDDNKDYIMISAEDAEAVLKGKKTGEQVVKELFLKSRMEEVGFEKGLVVDGANVSSPEHGPVVPVLNVEPEVDEEVDVTKMTAVELREYAKRYGFDFQYETKREMIAQIIEAEAKAKSVADDAIPAPVSDENPVTE